MRRTLAGLLFGLAYVCAAFALSGFLLQRTALDPERSSGASSAILADDGIRNQLVSTIVDAAVTQLAPDPTNPDQVALATTIRHNVPLVASHPEGQQLLAQIIKDAHARLIGARTAEVQITGQQLVPIVRTQQAALIPTITLPVPRITALDVARKVLHWAVPGAALGAAVLLLLGFATHPERYALLRSLGFGLLLLAVLAALVGYVIPRLAVPLLSDSPWADVPALLADDSLPLLIGLELVLLGGAAALFAAAGATRRRRRWSAPVSTYRYNEQRRWS